jgi:hypothetical protein
MCSLIQSTSHYSGSLLASLDVAHLINNPRSDHFHWVYVCYG